MNKVMMVFGLVVLMSGQSSAKLITVEDGASFVGRYNVEEGSSRECYVNKGDFPDFEVLEDKVDMINIRDFRGISIVDTAIHKSVLEFKTEKTKFIETQYVGSEKIVQYERYASYNGQIFETHGTLEVVQPGVVELHRTQSAGGSVFKETFCRFLKLRSSN